MSDTLTERLSQLGLSMPQVTAPAANYVTHLIDGDTLWISGQISVDGSDLIKGKLGADFSTEEGIGAARLCGLGIIAQINAAIGGDMAKFGRILKLVGFVNSTADFIDQPKVINGASDLMVEVFGEQGRHARSAVSAASLPLGVAVEIEAIVRLK